MEFYEERDFYQIQNPLLLDPVLDVIFGFLPKSSLSTCRLVCRQWKEVAEWHFIAKNWENPTHVELYDTAGILSFLSTYVQRNNRKCEYLRDADSAEEEEEKSPKNPEIQPKSPWCSFKLDLIQINKYQVKLFMDICSKCIRRISISPGICMNVSHLLSTLIQATPQLQSLEFSSIIIEQPMIEYVSLNPDRQSISDFFTWFEQNPIENPSLPLLKFTQLYQLHTKIYIEETALDQTERFFSTLFQLMPALRQFRVSELDVGKKWQEEIIIPAIIRSLQSHPPNQSSSASRPMLAQLTHLNIPYLDNNDLHQLTQCQLYHGLQLTFLSLKESRHHLDWHNLLSFLQGQRENLQELVLNFYRAALFIFFPPEMKMPGIRKLVLVWCSNTKLKVNFIPSILRHFPRLEELEVKRPWRYGRRLALSAPPASELAEINEKLAANKLEMKSMETEVEMESSGTKTKVSWICTELRKFSYAGQIETEDLKFLEEMTTLCPNVEDLSLEFSSGGRKIMRLVYENWTRVKRLKVQMYGWKTVVNMDGLFVGGPLTESEKKLREVKSILKDFQGKDWLIIHKEEDEIDKNNNEQRARGEKIGTGCDFDSPSLLNLKELRALEIRMGTAIDQSKKMCRHEPNTCFVGDSTINKVIVKMPHLKELIIDQSAVTKSCLQKLAKAKTFEKLHLCDKAGDLINLREEDSRCESGKWSEVNSRYLEGDELEGWSEKMGIFYSPCSCCMVV